MTAPKYDTGPLRIFAALIDWLILAFLLWIIHGIIAGLTSGKEEVIWHQFFTWLPVLYYIFFHHYYGRTIGKALMGLKVLDVSENKKLSLLQAIRRDIVYVVLQIIVTISILIAVTDDENALLYQSNEIVLSIYDWIILAWTVVELITMIKEELFMILLPLL